uniref:Flavin-containing monooxygenase n=1 Tax=Poecilia mexicana TaxID=48701 RepID=A0A3B3WGJ5_9TELE
MVQKVAVIGAGPCGLSSVKACLDEGLEPTCFESSDDIGGLWRYKLVPGRTNIYQCVIINSSKEMMAFSDFPPPAELPNSMHHTEVLLYLRLYAQTFSLLQHIHLQVGELIFIRGRTSMRQDSGTWRRRRQTVGGRRIFGTALIMSFFFPFFLRSISGIESFKGRYFHSWEYRNAKGLEGKRVVVIGFGNCGCDIAVDISRVAERVYLSTRSGAWVVGRVGPGGLPFDTTWISRLVVTLSSLFWAQIPVINDDLPGRIISGRIQVKPNVKEFRETSVVFTDRSIIDEVDVVVFATGYNYSFPFLPPDLQAKSGYRLRLYKHVIPPTLAHPTLAVVGFIHGLGAINSMAEMQARWSTRVFKGLISLPAEDVMVKEIETETATMNQKFVCSERNPLQVDVIPYTDSLAEQVGAKPNILQLLFTEPALVLQVVLGPYTSYQYRLSGPGKWAGARQAIFAQKQRIARPFRTRAVSEEPGNEASSKLSILLAFITGAALLCYLIYNWHLPFFHSVE